MMGVNDIEMLYKYFDNNFGNLKEDISDLKLDVKELKTRNEKEYINCPNTKKISEIDKEMGVVRFVVKYPKLVVSGIIFLILTNFFGAKEVKDIFSPENIQKIEQIKEIIDESNDEKNNLSYKYEEYDNMG